MSECLSFLSLLLLLQIKSELRWDVRNFSSNYSETKLSLTSWTKLIILYPSIGGERKVPISGLTSVYE